MVIIASQIQVGGTGVNLVVNLAAQLEQAFGPGARWIFLVGAWGAIFSSLLGVWQSIPYLFADFWGLMHKGQVPATRQKVDANSRPYRLYLYALASIPAVGLFWSFVFVQITYAVVGREYRNSRWTSALLIATMLFFVAAGYLNTEKKLTKNKPTSQATDDQAAPAERP